MKDGDNGYGAFITLHQIPIEKSAADFEIEELDRLMTEAIEQIRRLGISTHQLEANVTVLGRYLVDVFEDVDA